MSSLTTPPGIFLLSLSHRGLTLRRDGNELCLNGPQEKRNETIRQYLRERKTDLLNLFTFQEEVDAELPRLAREAEAEMSQTWQQMVQNAYHAALAEEFPDALHFPFPFGGRGRWLSGPHKDLYHLSLVNQQFRNRYSFLRWAKGHFTNAPRHHSSVRHAEEIITTLTLWWGNSTPIAPTKGNNNA